MNVKLTLTIEQQVVVMAKEYAAAHNRSLSDIIENYLKSLIAEHRPASMKPYSQITSSLQGAFREPDSFDYKEELKKRRDDKYLK